MVCCPGAALAALCGEIGATDWKVSALCVDNTTIKEEDLEELTDDITSSWDQKILGELVGLEILSAQYTEAYFAALKKAADIYRRAGL